MSDSPKQEELHVEEQPKVKNDPPIKPKSSKSVAVYLVILFAAAFLLLLMAYFMQQRSNNEVIDNLQNSVNQFKTMEELRSENETLRDELEQAEDQISQLEKQLTETELYRDASETAVENAIAEAADTQQQLEGHIILLTTYAQLEEALRAEDYETATSLYLSIMSSDAARNLNQFVYDLALVTQDGEPAFDLSARMTEIGVELDRLSPRGASELVVSASD